MKKIYSLIMAAAVAAPTVWAADITAPQRVASGLDCTSHALYDLLTAPGMKGAASAKKMQKAPGGVPTLIWDVPETATVEVMERDAAGFYEAASQAYLSNASGISVSIYTDGTDVYMPNVAHMFTAGAYLKGTKGDDRMTFPLPQAVYTQTNNTGLTQTVGYYYMTVLRFNEQAQWYLEDTDDTSLELVLNADHQYAYDCQGYTTVKNDLTGVSTDFPNRIIGIVDEAGDWVGYGDYYYRIYPFVGEKTAAPEADETVRHTLIYGYTGHHVEIVKNDKDIYIQGLSRYIPNAWVKGTIDGDKVSIPSGQYLGIAPFMGYFSYFNALEIKYETDRTTGQEVRNISVLPAAEFEYDSEKGTLVAKSDISICGGRQAKAYLEYFEMPKIQTIPEVSSYVPMTPVIGEYANKTANKTAGRIDFHIPTLSVTGDLLIPENLEWAFLIDGDTFALDPADYLKLKEEMEWIPNYFYDGFDISWSGTLHRLYFFVEAPETLGIQSRYTDDDGNVHYSEKAMVDAALGVKKVEADHGEVISSVCYDMTGARVADDARGLIIKIERYADGTTKATKSIR